MSYAVVRIRSGIKSAEGVSDTLMLLNLNRTNHCAVIPETDSYKGMLAMVKDYVTWGEINAETLAMLIKAKGKLEEGEAVDDAMVKAHTGYESTAVLAKAVADNKFVLNDFLGMKPVFRLPPPSKGYEGVKNHYNISRPTHGGSLGYRGEAINDLLKKMIMNKPLSPEEKKAKKTQRKKKSMVVQPAPAKSPEKTPKKSPPKKSTKKEA